MRRICGISITTADKHSHKNRCHLSSVYHSLPFNSTLFTTCCRVAISDNETKCPKCEELVVGHDEQSEHQRHMCRWSVATKYTTWRKS